MPQLTKQDVAEVVEEVLDRKLDEKLDEKFGLEPGGTFDEKLDKKLDEKLDSKLSAFVEHLDDKFDSLAEAVSLMGSNMKTLAQQSDLDEVKNDVKTIKLAVRETNRDLRHLEGNI